MSNLFRIIGASLFLFLCVNVSVAQQRTVALTFDDLPVAGTTDASEARSINTSILNSLDRHHAPAVGFVIERRVKEIGADSGLELLGQWVERGHDLGMVRIRSKQEVLIDKTAVFRISLLMSASPKTNS